MINQIIFERIHLIWPVLIGAGILWLLFFWKEWAGSFGIRLGIKVVVSAIAVAAIAMIALRPALKTKKKMGYTAILSPGYIVKQRDSLEKAHRNIRFIDYKPGQDITGLTETDDKIFLLGYGLQSFDLWQVEGLGVVFLQGSTPFGISQLKYEQQNTVGNEFFIKGSFQKATDGQQLVLRGPGNIPLDSVRLQSLESQTFQLKSKHLVQGKFVYQLITKDSAGVELSSLPLAVNIQVKQQLNVLMVNQFPSFETKYLKNFLAEIGHKVVVRNQVSKDRYKYEYFNTERKGGLRLSSLTLSQYDLLVIDAVALQKLPLSTRNNIQEAVKKEGLGVFIQLQENSFDTRISLLDASFLKQETKEIVIDPYEGSNVLKYPYVFKQDDLLEPIHEANSGIISAYRRTGAGRIGTTMLRNTYELVLEGKTNVYEGIWSVLITALSKRHAPEDVFSQKDIMVYKHAPFHFRLKTSQKDPNVISEEGYRVKLAQDIDFDQYWHGTSFPGKLGWNRLSAAHDSTAVFDFYVIDNTYLTGLEAYKTINENSRFFKHKEHRTALSAAIIPVSNWWFFIIFLLSMGYLWLEPKL